MARWMETEHRLPRGARLNSPSTDVKREASQPHCAPIYHHTNLTIGYPLLVNIVDGQGLEGLAVYAGPVRFK